MRYLAEQPRAGCSLRRRGKDIASGYRPTLVEGAVSSSYNSFSFPSMSFHVQYHDIISLLPLFEVNHVRSYESQRSGISTAQCVPANALRVPSKIIW